MATIPEALAVAVQHHQKGHLQQAEAIYRQILQEAPSNADALHLLGVIARQVGKHDQAIQYINQAIRIQPSEPAFHSNLGNALKDQGQLTEAVAQYQEALRLKPDYTEAFLNLGNALKDQGQLTEAVAQYQEALRLKPDYAEAHYNLGLALKEQGRLAEAVAQYQEALLLKPNYADAHNNLGNALKDQGQLTEAVSQYQEALRLKPDYAEAHNNLGVALNEQGQLAEAVAQYQEALRLNPDYTEAHYNLGNALKDQGQLAEAVAQYQEALRLNPDYAEAHNNLGIALNGQGQLAEAVAQYQETLRLKPDYADAHNNLGFVLNGQGQLTEAVARYQEALRLKPGYAEAHWNRALAWLLAGDFERGWPEYEWRWQRKDLISSKRSFSQPLWDGSSLAGRTILLHAEQGLGDTIQFIRYVPLVKRRGGTVVLECQPALLPLLQSCAGVDRLLAQGSSLPPFDVHAPLLSLPGILETTMSTIPAEVPYLFADASLVEHWRQELSPLTLPSPPTAGGEGRVRGRGFKIGVAWQGNPIHKNDKQRSIPLSVFEPLARLEGIRLFSLQKGTGSEELAQNAGRFPITDLGSRLETFMDTAAVLKNLDLVVACDTAVVHLAGAGHSCLGRPAVRSGLALAFGA